MSKTILSVLEVAAVVGLQFIPGVGQAVAGVLAGVGVGVTAAQGLTIATIALAGAEAGLNAIIAPGAPKPEQTETAIKSPTPPRVSGYGTQRLHMAYALYVTASDGTAIDVGVFHDGRVDGIVAYYLGDVRVTLGGNGYVQVGADGQFGDHSDLIRIVTRLGAATETAFSEVIAKVGDQWTGAHRGDGVVTAAVLSAPVKSKFFQRNYPTGGPNNMPLSLVMRLQPVFDWRDPAQSVSDPLTWRWSENAILHLAHYLLVRNGKDWAVHFAPTLAWWTAAANVCDEPVTVDGSQAVLTNAAPKGSGHLTLNSVAGLSTGTVITISATGNTSLSESRTVTMVGGNVVALSSPLDNDHPNGSQVTWGGTSTEARYRSCLVHKHTDAHKDVVSSLLACCDGWLQPRADGALVVYAGAYVAPDTTDLIGPDAIVGYSVQDWVDEENAVNQIAVTYISANHDYAAVDTDAWEDVEDQSARGKILATQLANQVPSYGQARRLAKATMARINAPQRGSITVNSRGRNIRGKRFIRLLIVDAGTTYLDAVVEITKLTRNMSTFGYTAEWILADANAYAWNAATEGGSPAPVGNPVALAPLAAPTIGSITPVYGQSAAFGQPGVRLTVIASGPARMDLTWYVRTRPVGGVSWVEQAYPDEDAGTSVTLQTDFVPLATLEAEVAYGVGDGRISPWAALASPTDASGGLPAAVHNLSVSANSDGSLIVADWDAAAFATSYQVEIIVEGS